MDNVTPEIRAMIEAAAEEKAKAIVQSTYFTLLTDLYTKMSNMESSQEEMNDILKGLCRLILEGSGEKEPSDEELDGM